MEKSINSSLKEIENDIKANEKILSDKTITTDCLIIKPANTWIEDAKKRPIPKMLYSEFWYEGELCILFADTNIGKSILAVQIAHSLSAGISIPGFINECQPLKVLYLDCELSDKQFENRYSDDYHSHFKFHLNFLRAEINSDVNMPKEFKNLEDYLSSTLGESILKNNVNVIVIDNLTFLKSDNEKAKDALILMKLLKQITRKHNCSVLVLAHTPKRDESKPISKNDLAGSKMLMNFCDSSFAIGSSTIDNSYRYLKQIKQRNTEHLYHSNNVVVCKIQKISNFLEFAFLEYGTEKEHLKQPTFNNRDDRDEEMTGLIEEGLSNVKIGEKLGISEGAVRKRRKKLGL